MKGWVAIGFLAVSALSPVHASGINGINGGMPNRISMNVTVAKQTQRADFGEKVNAGLHAAGNAVANGTSMLVLECGQAACALAFPDGGGYRADLKAMTLAPLASRQAARVRKAPAGAAVVGAALPGGSIVSAAVSSVGTLSGGGSGAASAGYAATGRMDGDQAPLRTEFDPQRGIDVLDPLAEGDYLLTVVVGNAAGDQSRAKVVEKATSGLKDTLKTNVRMAPSPQIRIVMGFRVENGELKARHDTAKNSIGNIR